VRNRTSDEYKKAIVRKLAASSLSDRQFAIEEGAAFSTLHKWKTRFHINTSGENEAEPGISDDWSAETKFAVVLESASLSEIELGEYCRRKGIYPEHLSVWKHACIQGNLKISDHKKEG